MALADTKDAMGAVTDLLKNRLTVNTAANTVDIGRPEEVSETNCPKFNLFLYQIDIDRHLKNFPLDQGQKPPLWLVLRYLLTAFDDGKESDSVDAHKLLGEGMLALQELNFIESTELALDDNPEPLKITFDVANSELLSKIMQGSDEKYRLSAAFQIRPVMLVPSAKPGYALPVKTVGQPGDEGAAVLPSLGPKIKTLTPVKFAPGEKITLTGLDIGTETEEIQLGGTAFPVVAAKVGEIRAVIGADTSLSAGSYSITAVRTLPGDLKISSNALLGYLLPVVNDATPGVLTLFGANLHGTLTLTGNHLGGVDDSIFVAFYRNGEVALMLEATGVAAQTSLVVTVEEEDALVPGNYFIILRVNGAQATNSPLVDWT